MTDETTYDAVIIGAGAAGLMCAIMAARNGRTVLVVDHAKKIGEKIRISGGGRCNFTNRDAGPDDYISENPRFCISALKGFTAADTVAWVESHGIAWHEKHMGQLFCDETALQIVDALLNDCRRVGARVQNETEVEGIEKTETGFTVTTNRGTYACAKLVIATGGKSVPKIGATGFGYKIAEQFGVPTVETRPGLVPLTFDDKTLEPLKDLAGVAVPARAVCGKAVYDDDLLFTHRGLSGPVILKISSHWREGRDVMIDLAPGVDAFETLKGARTEYPKQELQTILSHMVPKRLAAYLCAATDTSGRMVDGRAAPARMADLSDKKLQRVADHVNAWHIRPQGSEGYRTAEVTVGGVDTRALSSKTFECRDVPNLHFIGEVVDVTGNLGGYNFQWAWASGAACGRHI